MFFHNKGVFLRLILIFVLGTFTKLVYGGYLSTHRPPKEEPNVEILVAMEGHLLPVDDKYAVVEVGKDIVLSCLVTGTEATIKWVNSRGSTVKEGETYSIPDIQENQLQNYTCVANISTPEPLRAYTILTVERAPRCIRLVPVNGFETVNDNGKIDIRFDCQVEGVPLPEVTWYRITDSGEKLKIVNRTKNYQIYTIRSVNQRMIPTKISSLLIDNLRPDNYGLFYCDVNNRVGSCDSKLLEFPVYGRECKVTADGRDYMGTKDMTSSGRTCQRWDRNQPHFVYPTIKRKTKGQENFCRNPEFEINGSPWCYTTDPEKRFEVCDIHDCVAPEISLRVFVNGEEADIKEEQLQFHSVNVVWSVTSGSNITFICSATGDPEPYISWYSEIYTVSNSVYFPIRVQQRGGVDFFKESEHTITNYNKKDGSQTCLADNRAFPPVIRRVSISLRREPYCMKVESAVEKVDGKSVAKVTCVIGGDPKPEVVFYKKITKESEAEKLLYGEKYSLAIHPWENIVGLIYTLVINDFTPEDYGIYYCHATNEEGECPFLGPFQELTVDGDPKPEVVFYKKISKESEAEKLLYGEKYSLAIHPWENIVGLIYTLVINDFTPEDYGIYYCHATNEEGECPFLGPFQELTVDEKI